MKSSQKPMVFGAIATALGLYNILGASEEPGIALKLLQYGLLGLGLIGLVGGLIAAASER